MTTITAHDIARAIDPTKTPTDEQVAMIEAGPSPLLVVAGAGAGKTETMSQRILYAVATDQAVPSEVLGLTFTRKAAGELSERVRHRLKALRRSGLWRPARPTDGEGNTGTAEASGAISPIEADRPRVTTYDSFAGDIVSEFALRLGEDPAATLMTDARRWQVAQRVLLDWPETIETDKSLASLTTAVLGLSGALDEHLLTTDEARGQLDSLADDMLLGKPRTKETDAYLSLRTRAQLMDVVTEFRRRAREEGLIDFGGRVALATRIVREVPEVRETLRSRFRVVMLDEYQDTSVVQVALLSALFGDGHPVTAVGDPQQAIYGWRGASAGAMSQFHERFASARHDPATLTLSMSWRNETSILDLANDVARPTSHRGGLDQPELRPRDRAGTGRVLHHRAPDARAEAAAVADFFARAWNVEHREWARRAAEGAADLPEAPPKASAAILCRRRRLFGRLAPELEARGLPYRIVGLGGLLQQEDVVLVRCALSVVARPERGDAAMAVLRRVRLGAADLAVLHAFAERLAHLALAEATGGDVPDHVAARDEAGIVEALSRPIDAGFETRSGARFGAEAVERLARLRGVLDEARRRRHLPLGELVAVVEQLLGVDVDVAARGDATARAALDAFRREAVDFAVDAPEAGLAEFLDWLEHLEATEGVDMPQEDISGVDDAILLMTVHAAKGLEWDMVAVPELDEGRFPGYTSTEKETGNPKASAWLTDLASLPYPLRGDAAELPQFGQEAPGGGEPVPHLTGDYRTKKELEEILDAYRVACGTHEVAEARDLAYVALTRARSTLLVTSSREPRRGVELPESRFLPGAGRAAQLEGYDELYPEPEDAPGSENAEFGGADGADESDGAGAVEARGPGGELPAVAWPPETAPEPRRRAMDVVEAWMTSGEEPGYAAESDEVRRWTREAELLLAERERESGPSDDDALLPEKLTVTTLVRAQSNPDWVARELLRPVPREPSYVESRGTSVHAWIEQHYRAPALPADAGDGDLLDLLESEVSTGDVQRLRTAFLSSRWADRVPVAIEQDLAEVIDGLVVPGVADAVFDDAKGLEIVDWKTGTVPTSAADRAAREVQLHLYRLAWSRRTGRPMEEIGGVFVHLDAASGRATELVAERLGEAEVLRRVRASLEGLRAGASSLRRRARGEAPSGR